MAESLTITERTGLGLATIMARRGVDAAATGARLGLEASDQPYAVTNGALTLVAAGPGVWLAVAENAAPDFAERLTETLAGAASVSDQSGGYHILRMAGPGAADLIQSGAYIDLHPDAFPVGAAAVTVIAHIGVIFWKVDAAPTFDVATFSSFAGSFRDWIDSSAPFHT